MEGWTGSAPPECRFDEDENEEKDDDDGDGDEEDDDKENDDNDEENENTWLACLRSLFRVSHVREPLVGAEHGAITFWFFKIIIVARNTKNTEIQKITKIQQTLW